MSSSIHEQKLSSFLMRKGLINILTLLPKTYIEPTIIYYYFAITGGDLKLLGGDL